MGRRRAREAAFKCIYQLSFDYDCNINLLIDNSFEELEETEEKVAQETKITKTERRFVENTVKGVIDNLDEIDEIILRCLKNWTLDRINKIDLALLRLAIFEIKYSNEEVPVKVCINEAIELSKIYGTDDSYSFVNGVLAKVVNS